MPPSTFFKSPEELLKKVDEYFITGCDKRKLITKKGDVIEIPVITISGLAYYLGFNSRQSFYDYEQKPVFADAIKRARLRVESYYEAKAQDNNAAGPIFVLKNMGWRDQQHMDLGGSVDVKISGMKID